MTNSAEHDQTQRRADVAAAVGGMANPLGLALEMFAEDRYLLADAMRAYIGGSDAGAVFCAHAVCERELAGLVEHSGSAPSDSVRWGLGRLIDYCKQHALLPKAFLDPLARLNEHRKTLYHYGHAESAAALQRRALELIEQVGPQRLWKDFEARHGYAGEPKEVHGFAMDAVLRASALEAIKLMLDLRSHFAAGLWPIDKNLAQPEP